MKVAVIGNGGGGKTTLSRRLAQIYSLPLTHVDTIQFLPGFAVRPVEETRDLLNEIADGQCWLIDGFGPFDVMERRFRLASVVVFVDLPLWRHYWWATKRQMKSRWAPRLELVGGINEATFAHTWALYKILWRVHTRIRPQLLELFSQDEMREKVLRVNSVADWQRIHNCGFN